jgi:hypothetical protein
VRSLDLRRQDAGCAREARVSAVAGRTTAHRSHDR